MGIPFKANIGLETLRQRVTDRLNGKTQAGADTVDAEPDYVAFAGHTGAVVVPPKPETHQEIVDRVRNAALALVRCRIYNLNPSKRDLPGEIITVANKYVGTVRKHIPFGEATDNGYHIPMIIFNNLKSRRFQQVSTKTVNGQIVMTRRTAPEYSIDVMDPLTSEELSELGLKQAAAERMAGGQ